MRPPTACSLCEDETRAPLLLRLFELLPAPLLGLLRVSEGSEELRLITTTLCLHITLDRVWFGCLKIGAGACGPGTRSSDNSTRNEYADTVCWPPLLLPAAAAAARALPGKPSFSSLRAMMPT